MCTLVKLPSFEIMVEGKQVVGGIEWILWSCADEGVVGEWVEERGNIQCTDTPEKPKGERKGV